MMSRTRAGGRAGGGPELAVANAADARVARSAVGASSADAPGAERATRASADSPTSASEGAPADAPVRAPAAPRNKVGADKSSRAARVVERAVDQARGAQPLVGRRVSKAPMRLSPSQAEGRQLAHWRAGSRAPTQTDEEEAAEEEEEVDEPKISQLPSWLIGWDVRRPRGRLARAHAGGCAGDVLGRPSEHVSLVYPHVHELRGDAPLTVAGPLSMRTLQKRAVAVMSITVRCARSVERGRRAHRRIRRRALRCGSR